MIKLDGDQVAQLTALKNRQDWPGVYACINRIVRDAYNVSPENSHRAKLSALSTWLGVAESINRNDKSFLSEVVRGKMKSDGC